MAGLKGRLKYFAPSGIILFAVCLTLISGCNSKETNQPTEILRVEQTGINAGGILLVDNALPAWTEGQFGSVRLNTSGGTPPYSWTLKQGSEVPFGLTLSSDGTISGTPPLLSPGTSQSISPPFTVKVTDAAGQQKEVQLSITVLQEKDNEEGNPVNNEPSMSIDTINAKLTRTDNNNTEYYFDIEASGTASAPVGYTLSIKLDGYSPDAQTSAWTQEGTKEFAKLLFRRENGQPESTDWTAIWHNFMINEGQFEVNLNTATVELQITGDTDYYIDFLEKPYPVPHP